MSVGMIDIVLGAHAPALYTCTNAVIDSLIGYSAQHKLRLRKQRSKAIYASITNIPHDGSDEYASILYPNIGDPK